MKTKLKRCQTGVKGSIERIFETVCGFDIFNLFENDQQQRQRLKNQSANRIGEALFPQRFIRGNSRGRRIIQFLDVGAADFRSNKTMKCEELQFNLPLYAEGELDLDECSVIKEHLGTCPVCRVKLSEFQSLQNDFRMLARPVIPSDLVYSVRNSVAAELSVSQTPTWLTVEWREWLQMRLMPYSVGAIVSLSLAMAFLLSLNSIQNSTDKVIETARISSNRNVVSTNLPRRSSDSEIFITNEELVALRTPVSSESPSLNTRGALLTLTNSLMRGKMKNDEITFVADVFSNGLSQIAQVVEAPNSRQSMEELSNALENDPAFVPADLDRRSNVVRVVFKIQKVDVIDKKPTKSKRNL